MHRDLIIYASSVQEKLYDQGFRLIAIGSGESSGDSSYLASLFELTTFINDRHSALSQFFRARACCGAVYFYDEDARIVFSSETLISKEDLRTLVEKYLLGKITYRTDLQEGNLIIDDFHALRARSFISGEERSVLSSAPKYFFITLFTDICSSCASGRRLSLMIDLQASLAAQGKIRDCAIVSLFPDYYQLSDLLDRGFHLETLHPASFDYRIIPIEDRYFSSNDLSDFFPISYLVDNEGRLLDRFPAREDEGNIRRRVLGTIK
jgi:hypothetical protein